jgi:hypothetical protein
MADPSARMATASSPLARVRMKALSTGSRPKVMRSGLDEPALGGSSSSTTGELLNGRPRSRSSLSIWSHWASLRTRKR